MAPLSSRGIPRGTSDTGVGIARNWVLEEMARRTGDGARCHGGEKAEEGLSEKYVLWSDGDMLRGLLSRRMRLRGGKRAKSAKRRGEGRRLVRAGFRSRGGPGLEKGKDRRP
jgi:hypothetical protein